jgi:hypothetical protein
VERKEGFLMPEKEQNYLTWKKACSQGSQGYVYELILLK